MKDSQMLTKEQAAEYLQVSTRTLDRYITDGRLRAYKLDRAIRIKQEDLEAFIESSLIQPDAKPDSD